MVEDKSNKGFSVVDRRVTKQDEASTPEPKGQAPGKAPQSADVKCSSETAGQGECPSAAEAKKDYDEAAQTAPSGPLPPVSFPGFILSLHASALLHLGVLQDPNIKEDLFSLELARQNIDLLDILRDKTKGNLTQEESKLLDNVLYELRMVYIQVSETANKKESNQ